MLLVGRQAWLCVGQEIKNWLGYLGQGCLQHSALLCSSSMSRAHVGAQGPSHVVSGFPQVPGNSVYC